MSGKTAEQHDDRRLRYACGGHAREGESHETDERAIAQACNSVRPDRAQQLAGPSSATGDPCDQYVHKAGGREERVILSLII